MKKLLFLIFIIGSFSSAAAQNRAYLGDSLARVMPRYQGEISLGSVSYFNNEASISMWSFRTVHGVRKSDHFFGGVGVGLDISSLGTSHFWTLTVFYNARWYLINSKAVRLTLGLDAGLSLNFPHLYFLPLPHISPSVGVSFNVSPRSAINVRLGYEHIGIFAYGLHGISVCAGFQF